MLYFKKIESYSSKSKKIRFIIKRCAIQLLKLSYLDALRGYAILGVILTHTTRHFHGVIPETMYYFGIQGSRGVQLFFVVSAFTLFYSLEKYSLDRKFSLQDFYIKRLFRIAPMFYFALLFYMIFDFTNEIFGRYSNYPEISLSLILSTLTFTNVLHPDWLFSLVPGGWSISNEFLFYICLPLLFKWIRTPRQASIFVIFSILSSIFLQIVLKNASPFSEVKSYLFYWFPNQLSIFLMGIALYHVWKKYKFSSNTHHIIIILTVIGLILLSLTPYDPTAVFPKHVMFGFAFSLLAFGLSGVQSHLLNNRFMQFVGTISFSIYLVHFFVLDMVHHFLSSILLQSFAPSNALLIMFLITASFSIMASYITYRFIEVPGIKLGRLLIKLLTQDRTKKNVA